MKDVELQLSLPLRRHTELKEAIIHAFEFKAARKASAPCVVTSRTERGQLYARGNERLVPKIF